MIEELIIVSFALLYNDMFPLTLRLDDLIIKLESLFSSILQKIKSYLLSNFTILPMFKIRSWQVWARVACAAIKVRIIKK